MYDGARRSNAAREINVKSRREIEGRAGKSKRRASDAKRHASDAGMPGLRGDLGEVYIKNVFRYIYGKIAYYFMRGIKGNISRHFRSFFYRRRVLCYTMSQQVLRQFSDQIYPDAQIYRRLARQNSL